MFLRTSFPWVLIACLALGCGYKSDYTPPNDGRARGIWSDDKLAVVKPDELPRCRHEVPPPIAQQYAYYVPRDDDGYYVPPSGGGVVVVIVGAPPPLLLPPAPGLVVPGGVDGEGAKYIFVVMAVAAIAAFPFVAIGLAVGHPEPDDEVIPAIDSINRYNDEARRKAALCAATAPRAGTAR
jgi:hypothetical protein